MKYQRVVCVLFVSLLLLLPWTGFAEEPPPPAVPAATAAPAPVPPVSPPPAAPAGVENGAAAPAFSLPDVDGKTHALADFAGKWVVLEWTNYDCPFVRKHYDSKAMQELQKTFTDRGVVWLSICSSAPGKQGHFAPAVWKERMAAAGVAPTAVLLDGDGEVGRRYDARTTPHLFVVDPAGLVVYQGAIDSIRSTDPADVAKAVPHVRQILEAALAGQPLPEPTRTTPYGCSVKY